jgi:hypothetical protein
MRCAQLIENLPIFVTLTLQSLAVAVCTARFKVKNSTFCPHRVFMGLFKNLRRSNYYLPIAY